MAKIQTRLAGLRNNPPQKSGNSLTLNDFAQAGLKQYSSNLFSLSSRQLDLYVVKTILLRPNKTDKEKILLLQRYLAQEIDVQHALPGSLIPKEYGKNAVNHKFKTGFCDNSEFEDCLLAAIQVYRETILLPSEFANADEQMRKQALESRLTRNLQNYQTQTGKDSTSYQTEITKFMAKIDFSTQGCTESLKQHWPDLRAKLPEALQKSIASEIDLYGKGLVKFGETYGNVELSYQLEDFLQHAIYLFKQNKQQHTKKYSADEKKDLEELREIIADKEKPTKEKIQTLQAHQWRKDTSANMHKLCKQAIKKYQQMQVSNKLTHEFKTKIWQPKDIQAYQQNPRIVIALHGWNGNLSCWSALGQQARERDCKFIAYDQRGHGLDAEHQDQRLRPQQLRLDFRKFLQKIIDENPDAQIDLVGYSLGSSILLTETSHVIETHPNVNSFSYISPAMLTSHGDALVNSLKPSKNDMHDIGRNRIDDHERVVRNLTTSTLKALRTFVSLLRFMRTAYKAAKQLCQQPSTANNVNAVQKPTLHFYAAKNDKAVSGTPFAKLDKMASKNETPQLDVHFHSSKRAAHSIVNGAFDQSNSATVLNHIEPSTQPAPELRR